MGLRDRGKEKGKPMSESDEKTAGGLAGKVTGKAKELAGKLTENNALTREGRAQQDQAETGLRAHEEAREAKLAEHAAVIEQEETRTREERERVEAELEQKRTEQEAEAERAE